MKARMKVPSRSWKATWKKDSKPFVSSESCDIANHADPGLLIRRIPTGTNTGRSSYSQFSPISTILVLS